MLADPSSEKGHVLFVDDDADVLKAARLLLMRNGFRMSAAQSPLEAWSVLEADPVDVILLDLNFTRGAVSGEEGFAHLSEVLAQDAGAVVVVVTAHSGVNVAVAAMRAGAADFVMKPWSNERLMKTLASAMETRRKRLAASAAGEFKAEPGEGATAPLLGESAAISKVRDLIRRAAPTQAPILIYGAAGTGKSLIARNIHLSSPRANGPFLSLDLEALGAEEADLILFGDEGAEGAPGALIEAQGGTLCLDEIGSLGASTQAKLLAVLESGRMRRPGRGASSELDVRIVSTTRRSREELLARGGLKRDLLYRLNTVEIHTPSLQERDEDALLLARHFLRVACARFGRPIKDLSPEIERALVQADWVGDVRALRQAAERCVIFSEGARYELSDFPLRSDIGVEPGPAGESALNLIRTEKALVSAALTRHSFNVSHAARELGLSRAALYRRMAKHGF